MIHGRKPKRSISQRNELVTANLGLVKHIAHSVENSLPVHVDGGDLIQAGTLGLIGAAERYKPTYSVKFSSYAKLRIRGAILDYLRANDTASRVFRDLQDKADAAEQDLARELKRYPSQGEVANKLGIDMKRFGVIRNGAARDCLQSETDMDKEQRKRSEPRIPAEQHPDAIMIQSELRRTVQAALAFLGVRYRKVIEWYYVLGLNMKQIGQILSINESRVSQMHKRALAQLRVILQNRAVTANG